MGLEPIRLAAADLKYSARNPLALRTEVNALRESRLIRPECGFSGKKTPHPRIGHHPAMPRTYALHAWETGRPVSRDLSFVSDGDLDELQTAFLRLVTGTPHLRFDAEIVDQSTGRVALVPVAEGFELRWRVPGPIPQGGTRT